MRAPQDLNRLVEQTNPEQFDRPFEALDLVSRPPLDSIAKPNGFTDWQTASS